MGIDRLTAACTQSLAQRIQIDIGDLDNRNLYGVRMASESMLLGCTTYFNNFQSEVRVLILTAT